MKRDRVEQVPDHLDRVVLPRQKQHPSALLKEQLGFVELQGQHGGSPISQHHEDSQGGEVTQATWKRDAPGNSEQTQNQEQMAVLVVWNPLLNSWNSPE